MHIILVSCRIFCVLSNDMLHVSIGTFHIFLGDICTNIKVTKNHSAPVITNPYKDNKTPKLVCDFPKALAVICMN